MPGDVALPEIAAPSKLLFATWVEAFMRAQVVLVLGLVGCGGGAVSSDAGGQLEPVDAGAVDAGTVDAGTVDAGDTCTAATLLALEDKMRAALQSTVTDHSFYVELRRPGVDGRTFTFARNIDGVVDASSTIQSASTAKMISASVILDVVSNPQRYPGGGMVNGKALTLDSLARDFLPDGSGGTNWRTNTGALPATSRLNGVTLRQLLSFASGLELEKALGGAECLGAPAASFTHAACVRNLVTVNLARNLNAAEPRTFFYNGAHLNVAALMAVNAAGVANWAELFKKYKELHGVFTGAVAPMAPVAVAGPGAYYPFSDGTSSPNPAGAMRYRAGDYPGFLVQLQSGAILSAATLGELFSDQTTAAGVAIEYSPLSNDSPSEDWRYGLGLWNECQASVWSPSCATQRFSSPGSFGSYPFVDLNRQGADSFPLIGFLARGGTDMGTAMKGISVYRSLASSGGRDLAREWAANICRQ